MVSRKTILIVVFLVTISPIFGVILSEAVGYHEPLDIVAELLGLEDRTEDTNWTPLLDYTFPGLPDTVGYIVAGLIGVTIVLVLGHFLTEILVRKNV